MNKYSKEGQDFDPTKHTNLQEGTPDFDNYLKENNISKVNASIDKPVSPVNEISSDLLKTETPNLVNESKDRESIWGKINDTYKKYGGEAGANEALIQGIAKYKTGAAATEDDLKNIGGKIRDVLTSYGLADKLDDFGIEEPIKSEDKKPGDGGTGEPNNKAPVDPITEAYNNLIAYKSDSIGKEVDLKDKLNEKQQATIDLEKARQAMNEKKLVDYDKLKEIGDRPIPMSFINLQQGKYTEDEKLDNYMLAQSYNDALILQKLAEGNYLEAQSYNQQVANDKYEIAKLQIAKLEAEASIDQKQTESLYKQAEYELNLSTAGYTKLNGIEAVNTAIKQFGESRVWQDPVSKQYYLQPDKETQVTSTINVDGHLWGINANGDKVKDYGRTADFKFEQSDDGSIMVTDPSTGAVIYNEQPIQTDLSIGSGTITGINGSEKWEYGLDFVLAGGKGAGVKAPFIGEVVYAGENGGFGNQVKIDVGDGTEVWLSHLDEIFVNKGDTVNEEMLVGTQGNSGDVYSLTGGDGTHLDITMKKADGSYYKPQEVAKALGFSGGGSGNDTYTQNILTARLGKQIYGTRISDTESKRVENFIKAGTAQGKTQWDIIDDVVGYQIDEGADRNLADGLKGLLLQNTGESGLAGFDMLGLARLINDGNTTGAITKAENMVYKNAKGIDPDGFISESKVKSAIQKGNELGTYIDGLGDSPVGVIEGTMENWLGKFKSEEAVTIKAKVVNLVAKMRNELLGSAVTETEERFLEPLIPTINDTPANFAAKIQQLQSNPLLELNGYRTTFGLPELEYQTLFDKDLRANNYLTSSVDNTPDESNGGTTSSGLSYTIEE